MTPSSTKKRKVLEFVGRVSLGLKLMQIQKNAEEKFHNNWLLLSVNLPRWRWIDIVTSNLFLHQSTAQQNVEFKNKIYQQKFRGNVPKALQAIALAQTFFAVSDKFEKSQL